METSFFSNLAAWALELRKMEITSSALTDFAAKILAVSARDLAESSARKRGNGGFWGRLAEGVRCRADGASVTVDHVSNDANGLAEHVHKGGPIRPRNAKFLAIPINPSVKGEWASERVRRTPNGKPIFLRLKSRRAFLAEQTGKGRNRKLKPLFVLVRRTKPQKPRPRRPSDRDFAALAEREAERQVARWLHKKT